MNVSRVVRLLKLITTLRSGRPYDADALAAQIGVSRRTLFRDLSMLDQAGVPYRFEHTKSVYAISDSFFLPALHLEFDEALALLLTTRKFLSRQVHPAYEKALSAALKIESSIPASVLEHCGKTLEGISVQFPQATPTDTTSGIFRTLHHALSHRKRLRVCYDSVFDRKELTLELEPRRLIFMSRGWYLLAMSPTHGEARTFKVDRFVSVTPLDETFEVEPGGFDERAYFGNAWSMIPDGKLYEVRLLFKAEVASSVEEVMWHSTQSTVRQADQSLLFEATVDGLREISSWILGYAGQVEVLGPPELRERVRERAQQLVKSLSGPSREGDAACA